MYIKKYLDYLLLAFVFCVASIPLLKMGFAGDDISTSLIKGFLINDHITLFEFTKNGIVYWIHLGRFFPISCILNNYFCYFFGFNIALFNFVHWSLLTISYCTCCLFLKKLNVSNSMLLLFLCLFPFSWTLTLGSSLVSYVIFPELLIFIMLTLINYINFIQKRKNIYCVISVLFAILALLSYEIALLILPMILLLNKYYDGKFLTKNKAMYFISLSICLYLLLTLMLRHVFGVHYPGITMGHPILAPVTMLKELSGEIPLSFFLLYQKSLVEVNIIQYTLAAILVTCSFIIIYRLANRQNIQAPRAKYILGISLLLQIVPSLMIGLSHKYQTEGFVKFGNPYVTNFIEQVGFNFNTANLRKFHI